MNINPKLLSRLMGIMSNFGLLPNNLNDVFQDMYGKKPNVASSQAKEYGMDIPTQSHYSENKNINIGQLHDSIKSEVSLDNIFSIGKEMTSQPPSNVNQTDSVHTASVTPNVRKNWKVTNQGNQSH